MESFFLLTINTLYLISTMLPLLSFLGVEKPSRKIGQNFSLNLSLSLYKVAVPPNENLN